MMIECPACATRYEVPETAIGPDGRNVRCAKCHHSWQVYGQSRPAPDQDTLWNQDSPSSYVEGPNTEDVEHDAQTEIDEAISESGASLSEDADDNVAEASGAAFVDALSPDAPGMSPVRASRATEGSAEEPASPGRNRWSIRLLLWTAIIVIIVAAAALAATRLLGMPDWVPGDQSAFAASEPGLKLDFPDDQLGMRQLPDGTEIFGASGKITNVGSEARSVPPILIVLRDAHDRVVYSWEVTPSKRDLAPGESVAVNEAVTDVPRSARVADIGWKPG